MKNTDFWLIRAITNLHAGSGDADYGLVDKHVQRDPVTNLPVINASSIKGAFREAMSNHLGNDTNRIFGSENKGGKSENLVQGQYRFFSAKLFALPVRSSEDFFYVATCVELLDDFVKDAMIFGITLPKELVSNIKSLKNKKPDHGIPHRYGGSNNETRLEDMASSKQTGESGLEAIFGERVAILHATDFKQLSDELPIIARNHLESGISVNLWYEQVVPREARFYCPISGTDDLVAKTLKDKMTSLIQIGGNATVGYGLTRFTKL
jgi:CRISPR-associated protein Cmr4